MHGLVLRDQIEIHYERYKDLVHELRVLGWSELR